MKRKQTAIANFLTSAALVHSFAYRSNESAILKENRAACSDCLQGLVGALVVRTFFGPRQNLSVLAVHATVPQIDSLHKTYLNIKLFRIGNASHAVGHECSHPVDVNIT